MYKRIRIARVERKTKADKSKSSIFLRVFPLWIPRGGDFTFSTKICIDSNKWCNTVKKCRGNGIDSQRVNIQLSDLESKVNHLFDDYLKNNPLPNPKEFKTYLEYELFNKGAGLVTKIWVCDIFDRYLDLHGSTMGESRKKRYLFVKSKVNKFNSQNYGTEKLDLSKLNREWYLKFSEFMLSEYNYATDTLTGYLKVLRAAVLDLQKNGHIERFPFMNCKLERGAEKKRYLNNNELTKILEYKSNDERLQKVADCFIFASQTGLSHTDMRSLKKTMIRREGKQFVINKRRVKTGVESIIPVNDIAHNIILKYENDPSIANGKKVLPVIHLNDFNKILKRIADQCGLGHTNLTSHQARHAFATTVWLGQGGTIEVLQAILGHNNIRTTMRYGKINTQRVAKEALRVFGNPLKKEA